MHCRERWNDPVEENRNEEVLQDADETTAAQEQEPEDLILILQTLEIYLETYSEIYLAEADVVQETAMVL